MCNRNEFRELASTLSMDVDMADADAIYLDLDDNQISLPCEASRDVVVNDSTSFDELCVSSGTIAHSMRPIRSGAAVSKHSGSLRRNHRFNDCKTHRHLVTQHHYHDHASDPVVNYGPASPGKRHPSPSNNNSLATPFPTKLYEMIEKVETQGLSHVVSWQPHGRCFKVHDMPTFKLLLQNYFKLSKIASFQRQLNLYGFQRLTVGLDKGSYYHELFLRSRLDLASRIERVKVKGTGVRAKANPNDEPNLYSYPAVDKVADVLVSKVNSSYSITDRQEHPSLSFQTIPTLDEVVDTSQPTSVDVSDIASYPRDNSSDFVKPYNEIRVSTVSCDSTEAPCAIVNGLLRNISSQNVFPNNGNESMLSTANNRNATFPTSTPNLLRNVSSCVVDNSNNISFASIFPQNAIPDEQLNGVNQMTNAPRPYVMDFDSIHKRATFAVEQLRTISETEEDISFDKLIDEMFDQNQSLDFSDLVKLASDVDGKVKSSGSIRRRYTA
jgi:hypothetical protein